MGYIDKVWEFLIELFIKSHEVKDFMFSCHIDSLPRGGVQCCGSEIIFCGSISRSDFSGNFGSGSYLYSHYGPKAKF